jgi:hypothetical protein
MHKLRAEEEDRCPHCAHSAHTCRRRPLKRHATITGRIVHRFESGNRKIRPERLTARHVWGMPVAIGILSAIGLVSALL